MVNPTGMTWRYSYRPRGVDPISRRRPANRAVMLGNPDFSRATWAREGCAPLVTHGPVRDTVYKRLLAQAAALGCQANDAGDGAVTWAAPWTISQAHG